MENQSSNYEWYTREMFAKNSFKVYIKEGSIWPDEDKKGFSGIAFLGNKAGFVPKLRSGDIFVTALKPVECFVVSDVNGDVTSFKPYHLGNGETQEQWIARLNGGFRMPEELEYLFFVGTVINPDVTDVKEKDVIEAEDVIDEKDVKVKEPRFGIRFTTLVASGIFMAIVIILSALTAMGVSESALGYVAVLLFVAGLVAMWLITRKIYGPKKQKPW